MVSSKTIGIAGFGTIGIILVGFMVVNLINPNPVQELQDFGAAPEFTLPSIDGSNYSLSDNTGKVRVLNIMYTKCQAGCSVIVSKMDFVLERLIRDSLNDKVQFITVDFDFKYDNMTDLTTYSKLYHDDTSQWQFLLGNKNQTEDLTENYGFWYEEVNVTEGGHTGHEGHQVAYSHIFIIYLIDQYGHFRGTNLTGLTWDNDELYNRIDFLLNEYT